MNLRCIIVIYGCLLFLLCSIISCKRDKIQKDEKTQLEDMFLGSWLIQASSSNLNEVKNYAPAEENNKNIIYSFNKEHVLVVNIVDDSSKEDQNYFIPISYNYKAQLNNNQEEVNMSEQVGSWRILNDKSLIISHLNTKDQKLNLKTAKIIDLNKDQMILQETLYKDQLSEEGVLIKRIPETYYIKLKRIF